MELRLIEMAAPVPADLEGTYAAMVEALAAKVREAEEDARRWMRRAVQMQAALERQLPDAPPVVVLRGNLPPEKLAALRQAWSEAAPMRGRWLVLPETVAVDPAAYVPLRTFSRINPEPNPLSADEGLE